MLIFRAVEHNDDKTKSEKTKEQLLKTLKDDITAKYNMSEAEFKNIVQQIEKASSSNGGGPEWSYHESMSFVIQLVTTIGKMQIFLMLETTINILRTLRPDIIALVLSDKPCLFLNTAKYNSLLIIPKTTTF